MTFCGALEAGRTELVKKVAGGQGSVGGGGVISQHVDIILWKLFSFCSMADIIHTTLL